MAELATMREVAEQAIDPDVTSAAVVAAFWECLDGGIDPQAGYEAMRAHVAQARKNVRASAEATLLGQAAALNAIFADMARRAQAHMGRPGRAAERYLRLAMRAQNQCRATLNAVAELSGQRPDVVEPSERIVRIERRIVYPERRPNEEPVAAELAPCPAVDAAGSGTDVEGATSGSGEESRSYGARLDGGAARRLFADGARAQTVGGLHRSPYA
jgi:hypothetical protein